MATTPTGYRALTTDELKRLAYLAGEHQAWCAAMDFLDANYPATATTLTYTVVAEEGDGIIEDDTFYHSYEFGIFAVIATDAAGHVLMPDLSLPEWANFDPTAFGSDVDEALLSSAHIDLVHDNAGEFRYSRGDKPRFAILATLLVPADATF